MVSFIKSISNHFQLTPAQQPILYNYILVHSHNCNIIVSEYHSIFSAIIKPYLQASMTKQCVGSDECCGSLVEYMEM